ncbi:hypothetical protein J437_LFUL016280 [Ladona fulva]|uniref:Helix-turn-helix domain-containing protein n=1 Tax=Ladona fulva TaxID=123851 RepID=A0A8K0KLG0_LADFU|nr:hypothetical protein J437_LFUL016280 [Ladona fulva]
MAMGSPLSLLLAELFMDNFEKNLFFLPHPKLKQIIFWKRFVDDIFCIIDGTERDIQELLTGILKFLRFSISISKNKASLKVFRKPTYTDQVIPNSSSHRASQKYAAFHAMIHRLVNLPLSTQGYEEELNTIKSIVGNNGYNICLVENILKKKNAKLASAMIFPSLTPIESEGKKWEIVVGSSSEEAPVYQGIFIKQQF